jgi:hypothetical protein
MLFDAIHLAASIPANPSVTPPFRHLVQPLWQVLKGTRRAIRGVRTTCLPALDSGVSTVMLPQSLALALIEC